MTFIPYGSIDVNQNWRQVNGLVAKRPIKVRFVIADLDRVNSFLRIRGIYDSGACTPAVSLWPDNSPKIIEIPWSQEVVDSGDLITALSVRKFLQSRTRQFQRNDLDYSILLEVLQ